MSKTKKASYDDMISALTEALSVREKDLDAREEQLENDRQDFEKIRSVDYSNTNPSDVLDLNIGGVKRSVLRRTLTSIPDSMLATRFSGRWDDSIEKDKDGCFFIDQEYSMFRYIIKFLRQKAIGDGKRHSVPDLANIKGNAHPDKYEDFYEMVEYYGLTDAIYPVVLKTKKKDDPGYDLESGNVIRKEWTHFLLAPYGHSRRIKTFEVTLGIVERIQIGWHTLGLSLKLVDFNNGIGCGIGDIEGTLALDLKESSFLVDGAATPINDLEPSKGTVVRSEDFGRVWYVNGNLVAPFSRKKWDGMEKPLQSRYSEKHQLCPYISVSGQIEITSVEFGEAMKAV